EVATPEDKLEDTQASLWTYEEMPRNYNFPLYQDGRLPDLKHEDLETAKAELKAARQRYKKYFVKNPDAAVKHPVFGNMSRFEWKLLERKHLNHHFKQFGLFG